MAFLFMLFLTFLLGWSMPFLLSSVGTRRWKKEGKLLVEQALIERQRLMQETDILVSEKKKQMHSEIEHVHADLAKKQKNVHEKEASLKRKEESLDALTARVEEKRKRADLRAQEQDEAQKSLEKALLEIAGISKDQALTYYLDRLKQAQQETFQAYKGQIIQELVFEERNKIASCFEEILHSGYNIATTHSHFRLIPLSNDSSIPRIIGKEGKNIEGLSNVLGCDLWIDDEKKELILASYDDQKRFIAERVIRELVSKDIYSLAQAKATKEKFESTLEQEFILKGKEALHSARLSQNYPAPVLALLGSLDIRSSHGQNVLLHSIETAQMAKLGATLLQLSPDLAGAMALFHDIGKALDQSWGERHPIRGKAFLEKHHIDQKICDGVGSHHSVSGQTSQEAILIPYLDALSARGCAKRLLQQGTSFKNLRPLLEKMPGITSAWCIDNQTKLLIFLKIKEKSISQVDLEALFLQENINLPIEVQLLSQESALVQTLSFLPKKIS